MRPVGKVARDYRRSGYAVVESVFSAAECAALRHEVHRLGSLTQEQQLGDIVRVRAVSARQRAGVSRAAAGDNIFMLGDLTRYSDPLRRAISDPRVVALVKAALGHARPRYHFSNLTHKAPRVGPRVGFHRDLLNRLITLPVSRLCRAAICLDGMSARNGGLRFRPGSHRVSDCFVRANRRRKIQLRTSTAVHCGAGAVVLFHPKVIHGSGPNRSSDPRSNLVVQYGASYQRLLASQTERWTGHAPEGIRGPL